jgi:hypothetical protein
MNILCHGTRAADRRLRLKRRPPIKAIRKLMVKGIAASISERPPALCLAVSPPRDCTSGGTNTDTANPLIQPDSDEIKIPPRIRKALSRQFPVQLCRDSAGRCSGGEGERPIGIPLWESKRKVIPWY